MLLLKHGEKKRLIMMKWNNDFKAWQKKFYNGDEWKKIRNRIRKKYRMKCCHCHKLIRGRSIVDHIIEVTPDNKFDRNITMNEDNLQLLCQDCHNTKTFKSKEINFEIDERADVNLF